MTIRRPLSECVEIDDVLDLLIVDGVRIHRDLLRSLVEATPQGHWFRVLRVADVSHVEMRSDLHRFAQ